MTFQGEDKNETCDICLLRSLQIYVQINIKQLQLNVSHKIECQFVPMYEAKTLMIPMYVWNANWEVKYEIFLRCKPFISSVSGDNLV